MSDIKKVQTERLIGLGIFIFGFDFIFRSQKILTLIFLHDRILQDLSKFLSNILGYWIQCYSVTDERLKLENAILNS